MSTKKYVAKANTSAEMKVPRKAKAGRAGGREGEAC
jgi:hypothetical protein